MGITINFAIRLLEKIYNDLTDVVPSEAELRRLIQLTGRLDWQFKIKRDLRQQMLTYGQGDDLDLPPNVKWVLEFVGDPKACAKDFFLVKQCDDVTPQENPARNPLDLACGWNDKLILDAIGNHLIARWHMQRSALVEGVGNAGIKTAEATLVFGFTVSEVADELHKAAMPLYTLAVTEFDNLRYTQNTDGTFTFSMEVW